MEKKLPNLHDNIAEKINIIKFKYGYDNMRNNGYEKSLVQS